ncbi:MAG: hypothetical protein PUI86_01845, partial [Bacteroidales bacterium]|nr:hypothetical protein [Bacteroidales bacterium]
MEISERYMRDLVSTSFFLSLLHAASWKGITFTPPCKTTADRRAIVTSRHAAMTGTRLVRCRRLAATHKAASGNGGALSHKQKAGARHGDAASTASRRRVALAGW